MSKLLSIYAFLTSFLEEIYHFRKVTWVLKKVSLKGYKGTRATLTMQAISNPEEYSYFKNFVLPKAIFSPKMALSVRLELV